MNAFLRIGRVVLGLVLLIVGIAALVTPLTPGAWLALVGMELLGWGFLIPKGLRQYWKRDITERPQERSHMHTHVHPDELGKGSRKQEEEQDAAKEALKVKGR